MVFGSSLTVGQVKDELKRLRQGQGLAHPAAVLALSHGVRDALVGQSGLHTDTGDEVVRIVAALRRTVDSLGDHERRYAQVDFNLVSAHSYPTLTERQESLARQLKCVSKTVRRHADDALATLTLIIVTGERHLLTPGLAQEESPEPAGRARGTQDPDAVRWQGQLNRFWKFPPHARVDIICSEIPEEERPEFASPSDRNYLRYAKFADLDSLIYVRTRLAQLFSGTTIRDFSPSEYYDTGADALVVIGGPPWNAEYRQFLPQLPFYFEPHDLGEDDPLVVPQLDLTLGPRWTARNELLEDLAVFTRLTLAQGTMVFLLGGCLTLGVLGAAKCFLQGERAARNAHYVTDLAEGQDFVLVTEARRIGGIADMADLMMTEPLLILAREGSDPFTVMVDSTDRYISR